MTAREIIEKAKELGIEISEFAYGDFDTTPFGVVKLNIDCTGGKDKGSNWSSTHYFVDHNVYLKTSGYYQSYDGTYFDESWNSVKEVRPVQKTITVYE